MNKIRLGLLFLVILPAAVVAQNALSVVKGTVSPSFTGKVMLAHSFRGQTIREETDITPLEGKFAFAVAANSGDTARLFLIRDNGRHSKIALETVFQLPLVLAVNETIDIEVAGGDHGYAGKLSRSAGVEPGGLASISGQCESNGMPGEEIRVTATGAHGGERPIGTFRVTDHQFRILLPVESETAYQLQYKGFAGRVYLKPSDRLTIDIRLTRAAVADTSASTYVCTVDAGSVENKLLQEWQTLALPLFAKGYYKRLYTHDSAGMNAYSDNYSRVAEAAAGFRSRIHTGNPRFDSWMSLVIDADLAMAPLEYLKERNSRIFYALPAYLKENIEIPAFIRQRIAGTTLFSHTDILRLQGATAWLEMYARAKFAAVPAEQRGTMTDAQRVACLVDAPENDTLRATLLGIALRNPEQLNVNNLSEFREVLAPLEKYTAYGAETLNAYNALYTSYAPDTAIIGHPVKPITLPDINGLPVSLNGFKGKVVVIDTWATWCGPCKAQIPFLKEIEEEYSGNRDVVFVGVSTDRQQDSAKWKAMVGQLGLKGIQLIDYKGASFAWPYGISAIPRFLMMDKKGVWIEDRLPMPENKEKFKAYIDRALE